MVLFLSFVSCKNNKKKDYTGLHSSESIDYSSPDYIKNESKELKEKTLAEDSETPEPGSIKRLFDVNPYTNTESVSLDNQPGAPDWNKFGNTTNEKDKNEDADHTLSDNESFNLKALDQKKLLSESSNQNYAKQVRTGNTTTPPKKLTLVDLENLSKKQSADQKQQAKNNVTTQGLEDFKSTYADNGVTTDNTTRPPGKKTMADLQNDYNKQVAFQKDLTKNIGAKAEAVAYNPYMSFKSYEFDQYKTNYNRFKNSPCFQKLGFDPIRALKDSIGLEREYQVCEKEYRIKRNTKMFIYFFTALMLFIISIVLFKKYYKKRIH